MKHKSLIVSSVSLAVAISTIILLTVAEQCDYAFFCENFDDNDASKSDYGQFITAEFYPAYIKGLNRDYPVEPYKFTDDDSKVVSKFQKMMELAIDTANRYVNTGDRTSVNFLLDNNSGVYHITKPGPFNIRVESYMNNEEFDEYQLWADKKLTGVYPTYSNATNYYIQYDGEVFYVNYYKQDWDLMRDKETGENIWIHGEQGIENCHPIVPDLLPRLDLGNSNGTHSFDGRSCEWLEHKTSLYK